MRGIHYLLAVAAGLSVILTGPLVAQELPKDLSRAAAPTEVEAWAGQIQAGYPVEAMALREEGIVRMKIGVGTDGKVTNCFITASSGSMLLDRAACRGMAQFARYLPALDAKGKAMPASVDQAIMFALPEQHELYFQEAKSLNANRWAAQILQAYPSQSLRYGEEGLVAMDIVIDIDGRAAKCLVTQSSGHKRLDDAGCAGIRRYARYKPALNENGEPIRSTISQSIRYYMP